MNTRDLKLKRYLGDGVYAGYEPNGDFVWLWTSDGVRDGNEIALEAEVRVAVSKFFRDFLAFRASKRPMVELLEEAVHMDGLAKGADARLAAIEARLTALEQRWNPDTAPVHHVSEELRQKLARGAK